MQSAIRLEVLPASYGDCLLVTCPVPSGSWRLLVDTGPPETWSALSQRLAALPTDVTGHRHINLAVISHIDHDHIGGAQSLFGDQTLNLFFDDVWFNARHHLERGVGEGEALSELLGKTARPFDWNLAFAGSAASTRDDPFREIPAPPEHPQITLLSPPTRLLERLKEHWDTELAKFSRGESNTEPEGERAADLTDLTKLAERKNPLDSKPANGSSIAVLIEHQGASVLLGADAFPKVLGAAIVGLLRARSLSPPLYIDAFKLSHHGSHANLMPDLLSALQAKHYIISTDNTRYGHPGDETLARIILYGGHTPSLWFNYATDQNLRWTNTDLQSKYSFTTHFPSGSSGLILELPGSPLLS